MLTLLCEFGKFEYFKGWGGGSGPDDIWHNKVHQLAFTRETEYSSQICYHDYCHIQCRLRNIYRPRRFLVLKKKKSFHLNPSPFIRKIQRSGYIKKVCISHTLSTIINVLISKYYMKQWVQVLVPELTYGI